jgi:hypothetical protein
MRATRAAILVAATGLVVCAIWAATALLDQVQEPAHFTRAAVPGQLQVVLTLPGPHVIYHERARGPGASQSRPVAALEVSDPDGAQVRVEQYRNDLRYDHDDTLGTAVAIFSAPRTGTYAVTASDPDSAGGAIAVGDDLAPGVVRALALPALTAAAALALAALLVVIPLRVGQPESHHSPHSHREVLP